jgi:glycerate 2-kinase
MKTKPRIKIAVASDDWKGVFTPVRATGIIASAIRGSVGTEHVTVSCRPITDGGSGFLSTLSTSMSGQQKTAKVTGPLGDRVEAKWFMTSDGVAIIGASEANGLTLVPEARRDPRITTTHGVGTLIKRAIDAGAKHVFVGIGGSSTNDGGAGALQALGVIFHQGRRQIKAPINGGMLKQITAVELDGIAGRLANVTILCDVDNPLCGEHGAAHTFGAQKGATTVEARNDLDSALAHFAELLGKTAESNEPGCGAAGGLGFGLTLGGAKLKPGAAEVLKIVGFDEAVQNARFVITGEGSVDAQTLHGKGPITVARRVAELGGRTIALTGVLGRGHEKCVGPGLFEAVHSVCGPNLTRDASLQDPEGHLKALVQRVIVPMLM